MSISSLKLIYSSTMIPQTIINKLLAGAVPLKKSSARTVPVEK